MKKSINLRSIISMILALILCVSLPVTVWAETTTDTQTDPVTGMVTTTTTTTEPNEQGGTTVIVTVHQEGEQDGGDYVKDVETTTDSDAEDNVTHTVEEGSESTTNLVKEDNGEEAGQPEVTVQIKPGESNSNIAGTTVTTGDVPKGDNDLNYNYTETSTIEREVTVEGSACEVTVENTGSGDFAPIQTDRNMIYDPDNQLHSHWKTSYRPLVTPSANLKQPGEGGYDFLFIGQGQMSDFYVGTERPDGSEGISGALQFELINNPEVENGAFVNDMDKDKFTAYCVDLATGAIGGYWYRMDNLEDAGYYDEGDAASIRAIVSTGYWGTHPGEDASNPAVGSLEALKIELKKNPAAVGLTVEEIDAITPGQALAATQAAIWNYANDENRGQIVDNDRLIVNGYKYGEDASVDEVTQDTYKKTKAIFNFLCNLSPIDSTASTTIIDQDSFIEEDSMSITVGDMVADAEENKDEDQDNNLYNVDVNFALVVTPSDEKDNLIVQIVRFGTDGEMYIEAQGRIAGDASADENFNDVVFDEATGTYSLQGLKLAENEDFSFDIKLVGTQYLEQGVYIFSSEVRNGTSSQTFVGMAEGDKNVDVTQSFVINFDVDENDKTRVEHIWRYDDGAPQDPPQDEPDPVFPDSDPDPDPEDNDPTPGDNTPTPFSTEEEIRDEDVPLDEEPEEDFEEDDEIEIIDEEIPLAEVPETGDASDIMMLVVIFAVIGLIVVNLPMKKRFNA